MKKTVSLSTLIQRVEKLGAELGGVFSYTDLFHLIGTGSNLQNIRTIQKLIREQVLFKVRRGFYVTRRPNLWVLACRLKKKSYISMDSVLAKNGLIGTVPQGSVSVVYPGLRRETVDTPFGILRFFSIKKDLLFGISNQLNGVYVADNEKAYLDLLYYRAKGAKFVIDPLHEINLGELDRKKLERYLKKYKNTKFVSFVRGVLNESN